MGWTLHPHKIPLRKAARARNNANAQPRRAYVTRRESIPVWGVEARNEAVAEWLAPWRRSEAARGSTPQEHMGIGTPKRAAFMASYFVCCPRCFVIKVREIIWEREPAARKPKRR